MFAGNFAPAGWAFCNGQLMSISQNTALFSLLGTNFGGNGTTNFGLPNLQGRFPMHFGNGATLSPRSLGEMDGVTSVALAANQAPSHSHLPQAAASGGLTTPAGNVWGTAKIGKGALYAYAPSGANNIAMNAQAVLSNGGGLPHNNMPPYLCLTFIIALQGIFPARN